MPRRKGLTDRQIESLPRQAKRTIIADPEQRGLYLRIPPVSNLNAPITFTAVARDPYGKQIWTALGGTTADLNVDQARSESAGSGTQNQRRQAGNRATKTAAGQRGRGGGELATAPC